MSLLTEAFALLRSDAIGSPDRWRPVYRRALVDAFEQHQLDDAAELAVFAGTALEAQGSYEDAVAELESAIPRASGSADATVTLLGTLAITHAFRGRREAFAVLEAARALLPSLEREYTRLYLESLTANVNLVFLVSGAVEESIGVARTAREAGYPWIGQGLDIWAIPAIAASGSVRRARPWTQVLAAEAEATKSAYRRVDAAAIEYGLDAARAPVELDDAALQLVPRNRMAHWRARTAALRSSVLRGDQEAARGHLDVLRHLATHVNPGHAWSLPAFEAVVEGFDEHPAPDLQPPDDLTLVNLPGVLASLEVIVARGSQQQALEWLRWCEEALPAEVVSSLEWPASVERLTGLLMTRGLGRRGTRLLERGVRRLREDDNAVELAICQAQLAELLALGPRVESRRWPALRRDARAALRDLGVDLQPVTTVATDAIAWGRVAAETPRLSAREIEVLALLSEGLTQREIGHRLGIGWRTVQTHARSIYGKLDVRGRMAAANRARELGILSAGSDEGW